MNLINHCVASFGHLFHCNKILEGETRTEPFTSSRHVQLKNSHVGSVQVAGDIDLCSSTAGNILVTGKLDAHNCAKLGMIEASGHIHMTNCVDVEGVKGSQELSLLRTQVSGNVKHESLHVHIEQVERVGSEVNINESAIAGKLECNDRKVKISNSFVNEVVMKRYELPPTFVELMPFFNSLNKKAAEHIKKYTSSSEQVVELSGTNCVVNSITFPEGVAGKVILKNGAKMAGSVIRGVVITES